MEVMTTKMVAEYFGVGLEAIQSCYKDNKVEIDEDGVILKPHGEFLTVLQGQLEHKRGKTVVIMVNGGIVEVPNRGTKVFPRRAILRIAMLLRDSEIAKEIRSSSDNRKIIFPQ